MQRGIDVEGFRPSLTTGLRCRLCSLVSSSLCYRRSRGHRNKIGLDVAMEGLKDARARSKASVDDIWRFAKVGRVTNLIRPYLESIG